MGGERNSIENQQEKKSNEITAATTSFNLFWAKRNDELCKGDENAESSEKGDCKGTFTEKDDNLIRSEKGYPNVLEESTGIMKASRQIQSDVYDQMNKRITVFRKFQCRSNNEYMRSLQRANETIELGLS